MRATYPLRRAQIDEYIAALTKAIGRPRTPVLEDELKKFCRDDNLAEMILFVAASIGMGKLKVRVCCDAPSGETSKLSWPSPVPVFGTREFKNLILTLSVSRSDDLFFLRGLFISPSERMICWSARSMAKLLLCSILHPLGNTHEAQDLAAMILGYREVYLRYAQTGRRQAKVETQQSLEEDLKLSGISLTAEDVVYAHTMIDCIR